MKQAALVTGGTKRIGKSIVMALADMGYDIALHYHRSRALAQKTAAQLRAKGRRCQIFQYNLANQQEAEGIIPTVMRYFPALQVLVNNASIFFPSTLTRSNPDKLDRAMGVNFRAPYILSGHFARHCSRGCIINLLDTHIMRDTTSHADYLLSKKALADLTRLQAAEFAPRIRVNAVAPGLILPPASKGQAYLKKLARTIPLKRKGNPAYIAHAVRFLLENDFVTGQTVFVDGGEHLNRS